MGMSYDQTPEGSTLRNAGSAGTLGSIVQALADPAGGAEPVRSGVHGAGTSPAAGFGRAVGGPASWSERESSARLPVDGSTRHGLP